MYTRFAFALLFSVCAFGFGQAQLVGGFRPLPPQNTQDEVHLVGGIRPVPPHSEMQCPNNEEFHPCGSACAPTCANPHPSPVCTRQCVIGCFCKPGFLRNKYHVCVPSANCDAVPMTDMLFAYPPGYVPEMKPPQKCGENEEFRQCKGCDGTCAKPNPPCPRICVPGCACKLGHVRMGSNGKCIMQEQCPKADIISFMMMPPVCGADQEFRTCGTACPPTCEKPHPDICTKQCVIGCFCKEGLLKNSKGACVTAANCDEPTPVAAAAVEMRPYGDDILCPSEHEIYIEDDLAAQLNCMSSCGTPLPFMIHGRPQVPKKCQGVTKGPMCVCRFPLVRNQAGKCVERSQCEHTMTTPSH